MLAIRWFLLLAVIAAPAAAQLVESIEVKITNVEVVVTDRSGKPVHGLTREDFEIVEGGKPQPITNFYEVRADQPPARTAEADAESDDVVAEERRQRKIIVFIDNTSLEPHRRNVAMKEIGAALDALMRPGDDAMVAMWDRRMRVLQPFTTDASEVRRVINSSASFAGGGPLMAAEKQRVLSTVQDLLASARQSRGRGRSIADAYRESISIARAYAESLFVSTRGLLGGMRQMITTLSGLEGRKVLIMVGGELQQRPGLDVLEQVNSIFAPYGVGVPSMLTSDTDRTLVTDLEKVIRVSAGSGVSMYMIDAADRSGSKINATGDEDAFAEFIGSTGTFLTMGQLADATGGRAISGSSSYQTVLDELERDLGSYYSLGYRATSDTGMKSVRVRVRTPGLRVRSRKFIMHKTTHEQMEDRVVSNVFHRRGEGDFPVTITTAPPQRDGRNYKIDVRVEFPSTLTYLPDGASLAGEFGIYFVVASRDGALSPVSSTVKPVKFAAADAAAIYAMPFHFTTTVVVRPGEQTVSVAVIDRVDGRAGFGTADIVAR
ncbi:MAG TPA: VWA domain-containing protein [Thermoanaerobaculia bacterium]